MNLLGKPYSQTATFKGGQLFIGDCSVSELVDKYDSPLFVIDKADFINRANSWKQAFESNLGNQAGDVYYAGKAFINSEIALWLYDLNINLDLCSGGELAVAQKAKFPSSRIEFHGNNKSESELESAVRSEVGAVVIDSFIEITRLANIALNLGKKQKVMLRITPGIDAHTHEFIRTSQEDVKFGFSLSSGDAQKAIEQVEKEPSLELIGLHCHIGSQIYNLDSYREAILRLITLFNFHQQNYQTKLQYFNLGGGFGVAYLPTDDQLDPNKTMAEIGKVFIDITAKNNLSHLKLSIEPGRAIAAPSTTTIYQVGTVKNVNLENGEQRKYISVDGGFIDNMRTALYDATYTAILANRESNAGNINSRIVGKHCESGDVIIKEISLPEDIGAKDLLAIPATGAYGRSMASNYNHMLRPAVVVVENGSAGVILRREKMEDLLNLEQKLEMSPISDKG